MSTFDLLTDLPLEVDGYTLEGLQANVSSGFERLTTPDLGGMATTSQVTAAVCDILRAMAARGEVAGPEG